MPVSKSQQRAVRKYTKKSYDRMELIIPKGEKARLKKAAASQGKSLNAFVAGAINAELKKNGLQPMVFKSEGTKTAAE